MIELNLSMKIGGWLRCILFGIALVACSIGPAAAQVADNTAPDSAAALLRLGDLYSQGNGVPVDQARAYGYYAAAAAAGNPDAKVRAAEMLAQGEGVPRDAARGLAVISAAAANGAPTLYVTLGDLLIDGKSGNADPAAAVRAYEQAALAGNIDGDMRLAQLYLDGTGVRADHVKAFAYFEKSMNAGSESATVQAARMLIMGDGTQQDVERGSQILDRLALVASTPTLIAIGDLFAGKSPGVPLDLTRAVAYYQKAAQNEDPLALLALGDALTRVSPSAPDSDAIIAAYEAAAAKGNVDALLRLGDLFTEGRVLPPNLDRAERYYAAATKEGSSSGRVALAGFRAEGGDAQGALAELKALAATGIDSAYVMIGDLLASGRGGLLDAQSAIAAYVQAAKSGRTDAMIKLGDLYRYGGLVKKNGATAAGYYQMAADAGSAYGVYALGRGYLESDLGAPGTAARGLDLLKKAEDQGVPEASVAIAEAYEFGYGVKSSMPMAIKLLEDSAAAGNTAAISHLVGIYRDGIKTHGRRLTWPNLAQAQSALARYGDKLDRGSLLFEQLLLDAAGPGAALAGGRIAARLGELSSRQRSELLGDLVDTNLNTLVAVIQTRHRELGLYSGKVTGLLTGSTRSSIAKFCATRATKAVCTNGLLTRDIAMVEADAFTNYAPSGGD
ncbi:MAG: tetratricopeptide repeat protein [Devosia sp.]